MERRAAGLKTARLGGCGDGIGLRQWARGGEKVTAELRNLPHIASMALMEPLMLEPAYARVFFVRLQASLGSAA